jgi:hypothetical protein
MADEPDHEADPAITGVPPETPDDVRPSATGLVVGPVDGETDIEVAAVGGDVRRAGDGAEADDDDGTGSVDRLLEDAEGGIEASTLDAPED